MTKSTETLISELRQHEVTLMQEAAEQLADFLRMQRAIERYAERLGESPWFSDDLLAIIGWEHTFSAIGSSGDQCGVCLRDLRSAVHERKAAHPVKIALHGELHDAIRDIGGEE